MDEKGGRNTQIFCLAWVKRGAAKLHPDRITLNPEELKNIIGNDDGWEDVSEADDKDDSDNKKDNDSAHASACISKDNEDELGEYDLDNYDDDQGDFSGIAGLVMFAKDDDDPYITKKAEANGSSDSDDEEKSAMNLRPDDNLLVCARCGQHSSVLEVFVYNHSTKDFYVHHDIPLMDTPLCMQWIGFDPGASDDKSGNLVALGNFNSTIDIWDIDISNTLEPVFTIGQAAKNVKKKTKVNKKFSHTDAILDLSWSANVNDMLASASADEIVALWDLELGLATNVFNEHSSKVQSVEWQPESKDHLASGAFDGRLFYLDRRSTKAVSSWSLDGEIERIAWHQRDSHYLAAGTDNGLVYYLDCRKPGSHLIKWQAHSNAVPGLFLSSQLSSSQSFICTASSDGFVKVWDLSTELKTANLINEKVMNIGMVHCMQSNPDERFILGCGGQKEAVRLWDMTQTTKVAKYLGVSNVDSKGCDTLRPLGGGGENDEDVLNYVAGEDYIDPVKIDKLSRQGGTKKKPKKKTLKVEENALGGTEVKSDVAVKNTKKRKRKKKPKSQASDEK